MIAAATALLAPGFEAHSGAPGMAKIFGRSAAQDLRARSSFSSKARRADYYGRWRVGQQFRAGVERRGAKLARQNTDGPCGAGLGSCAPGYCCSQGVRMVMNGF